MATIRPNDNAPAEVVKYILPTATFDLASGDSYDTDDRQVLSDAEIHPWLSVEYPEVDPALTAVPDPHVAPEDDPLSSENPANKVVNDPEAIAKFEAEKRGETAHPLAVNAGLDQGEAESVGQEGHEVAVTLAADDTTTDDKPRRSSRRASKED